jgi:hypothetical protein
VVQDSDDTSSVRDDNIQKLDEEFDKDVEMHQESEDEGAYNDEDGMIEKDLDNWI